MGFIDPALLKLHDEKFGLLRIIPSSTKTIASTYLAALLVGCDEKGPNPLPYPPLDAKALVGCWQEPSFREDCSIRCFDRSGGYFLSRTFTARNRELREDSGVYSISQNDIALDRLLRTTLGKEELSDDGLRFTIIDDRLQGTEPVGAYVLTRVHPDSFPCGLKPWTLFQKPAGWDSLIQPY